MLEKELIEKTKSKVNFDRHVKAGQERVGWRKVAKCLANDLASTIRKLDNANRLIDRKNESLDIFLRYCEAHGISGDDIRKWHERSSNSKQPVSEQDHTVERSKQIVYAHCGSCRYWNEDSAEKDYGTCHKTKNVTGRCTKHCTQFVAKIRKRNP